MSKKEGGGVKREKGGEKKKKGWASFFLLSCSK